MTDPSLATSAPGTPSAPPAAPNGGRPPIAVCDGVSRIYRPSGRVEVRALDAVSLTLREGERVAVLGTSGSGKSTLMNLLGGLDRPDAGTIHVGGRDLRTMTLRDLADYRAAAVGFVFQSFHLQPSHRAWENVALPLAFRGVGRATRRKAAREMLARVGLHDRADHTPSEMSGGQQQRVAIARALIGSPRLVLADEPTGNLDTTTGHEVMQAMLAVVAENRATLAIVTHDLAVAQAYATRIITMSDGRIVSDAPNDPTGAPPAGGPRG